MAPAQVEALGVEVYPHEKGQTILLRRFGHNYLGFLWGVHSPFPPRFLAGFDGVHLDSKLDYLEPFSPIHTIFA